MKKIVYLSFGLINKNLNDALYINSFLSNKIEVELVDITSLLIKKKVSYSLDNIITINSYVELEKYFFKHNKAKTLYNIQIYYESKFFILLKKYNCKISISEIGYLFTFDTTQKIQKYLKNSIQLLKRISFLIFHKLLVKFNFINLYYDIKFVADNTALKITQKNSKEIVEINYIDYENNRDINSSFNNEKKYFFFLDVYLCQHQDYNFFKISNLNQMSDEYVSQNVHKSVCFTSIGQLRYLSSLQYVDAVLGNSFSGFLTPSVKISTLDIGDREKANSVIDCELKKSSILQAFAKVYSKDFQKNLKDSINYYGCASMKIIEELKKTDLKNRFKKLFYDLEFEESR